MVFCHAVNLRLDHIGVQVRDLAPAIELFTNLFGYRQATTPVINSRHGVEIVFLEKPGSLPIKLFRSVDEARPQPPKLHHLAFKVDDVAEAVATLSGKGARVLDPPAPGEAFEDELIAFLFAGGLNVELVATDRRRGRIPGPDDKLE
jgi:catechol 2,3-dioxygenase-like lactoylglutathione lyase family enzyme